MWQNSLVLKVHLQAFILALSCSLKHIEVEILLYTEKSLDWIGKNLAWTI